MGRKKKPPVPVKKPVDQQETPFNPAFRDLASAMNMSREKREKPVPRPPPKPDSRLDDDRDFLDAMAGVTPLPGEKKRPVRFQEGAAQPSHPAPDDMKKAVDHLNALVDGSIEMDITYSDEYIEGSVRGLSRKTLKRLKKGQLPVQSYVDLHGLTRREAEKRVKNFLLESRKMGLRCVLIVHGRGLNSPDSFPVLKENIPAWLGRGPARRAVLAFTTARPYDGGTGAVYVLLRKPP
jgi:DNA-nicking Smr family endonuclease